MNELKSFAVAGGLLAAAVCLVGCSADVRSDAIVRITVSPDGPISTLQAARDEVRRLKQTNGGLPSGGIVVEVDDGCYRLDEPVQLSADDSGDPERPVLWRARNRGCVTLTGGRAVTGWRPVTTASVRDRLPAAARPHVVEAALPVASVPDFGGGSEECYAKRLNYPLWLYQGDERLPLARYPNRPPVERTGEGFIRTGLTVGGDRGRFERYRKSVSGVFHVDDPRLDNWARERDLWVYGLFMHEYADMKMSVTNVDAKARTFALDNRWYPRGFKEENAPFYVFNALCELDQPGEWVCDRAARKVWLWPLADPATTPPVLGVTPFLVVATNLHDVVFDGFAFRETRQDAVVLDGCSNVTVRACTFRSTGAWGVTVRGGRDDRVAGCDFTHLGEGGVRVSGGDWRTLAPARHRVANCHIDHYGEVIPSYRPGVSLAGVGCIAEHNLIHHTVHQGVWFNGNDHLIARNVIHDTCLFNDDAGAVYCCQRDFTKRGTVIEGNVIHATGKRPNGENIHAVYLDDWSSGTIVRGNFVAGGTWGFHFGGGQATVCTNNLAVAFQRWCYLGDRRWPPSFPNGVIGTNSSFYAKLTDNAALWETPAWKNRYPHLLDPLAITNKVLAHDPINCVIRDNLFWCAGKEKIMSAPELQPYLTVTGNVVSVENPGVADYAHLDFSLLPGSRADRFFGGNAPWRTAGLFASPDRASPPVRFGAGAYLPPLLKGAPKILLGPAVVRIDVYCDKLPDGVDALGRDFDQAFLLASQKGRRIVGYSETREAKPAWQNCSFAFTPTYSGTAHIVLSGRFGDMTEYRNVAVAGATLSKPLAGTANHDHQIGARLTFEKGRRVSVTFEARRAVDQ